MKYKTRYGETFEVDAFRSNSMNNNNLAVVLILDTGEPFATLTTNLNIPLEPNKAYVDTNNMPSAEDFIKDNGLGKPLHKQGYSGYCSYPLYEFDLDKIKELK